MSDLKELAKKLESLDDQIISCMKCGLCQPVCPIFNSTMQEADVARGKLALIDNLSKHILTDADALAEKLERCLMCGSCQAACPPGVEIMDIFMKAREVVFGYVGLPLIKKLIFRQMLAKTWLFNTAMRVGAPLSRLVFWKTNKDHGTYSAPLLSPIIGKRHVRPLPLTPLHVAVGAMDTPAGSSGIKVAFFSGCVGDKMYVDMSKACLKVLDHHGVGVYMPKSFPCCGLPAIVSGDADGVLKQLKPSLDLLMKGEFDYLITPCGSCTATLKEFWPKYAPRLSKEYGEYAEGLEHKVMDINAFLINVLKVESKPTKAGAVKVTYHDSCHLRKSLGVISEPRKVIGLSGEYEFIEMANAEKCCGSGGSFSLAYHDISLDIGMRKRQDVTESGAEIVAMGCPACMIQIEDVLSQKGDKVRVKHTIELYAESLDK